MRNQFKLRKSPGPDGFSNEMIKYADSPRFQALITELIRRIWTDEVIPDN